MSACTFEFTTPDGVTRESKLFPALEKKLVNFPGKAEEIIKLIHGGSIDFEVIYGNWQKDPEGFLAKHKSNFKNDVLYSYPKPGTLGLTEEQLIYGEPDVAVVMDYWDRILKERYDFNTGQFRNVGSATEAILLNIASKLELVIEKLKRDRDQTRRRGKVRTEKEEIEKSLNTESSFEAAKGLLQYALNAAKIVADIRTEIQDLSTRLGEELDPNDSSVAASARKIFEFLNGYNETAELLAIVRREELDFPVDPNTGKDNPNRSKNINLVTAGLTAEERKQLLEALEAIEAETTSIEKMYEKMAEDFVSAKFNTKEEEIIQWHTEKFVRDFKKQYPRRKKEKDKNGKIIPAETEEEYDKRMNEYVESKLETVADFISQRSESIFRNLLYSSNKDISGFHRWFMSALNVPSPLLRSIQKEISVVEDNIRREWMEDVTDFDDAYRELLKYEEEQGNTKGKLGDFWNWLMDTNEKGDPTGYFVAEYSGEWFSEVENVRNSIFSDTTLTYSEKSQKWKQWREGINARGYTVEGHVKFIFKVPGDKTDYSIEYGIKKQKAAQTKEYGDLNAFMDEMRQRHREAGSLFEVPNPKAFKKEEFAKFKSKKYEELMALPADHPRRIYYKKYMQASAQNDAGLPSSFRLGYKMPTIRKSLAERFHDINPVPWKFFGTGVGSFYKEIIKPWSQESVDYVPGEVSERGEEIFDEDKKVVNVDSTHKQRQHIPIYYRGEIEPEDLTRDLHGSLLKSMYVSKAYGYMSDLLPYIEMMLYFLDPKNHKTFQNEGGSKLFGKGAVGRLLKKDATNTYEAARDLIEARMYGITMIDPGWEIGPQGKKIKLIKLVGLFQTYISTTLLAGNYHSSWANANLGHTMTAIEAVGGEFFGVKALAEANKSYLMDSSNIMRDLTERKDRYSTVNLFNEIFDPLNNFYHGKYSYAHNSKLANFMKNTSLHFLNNSVEHHVQSVSLLAYLKSIYVKDIDGSYINKKGEKVESRSEAMTLFDAHKKKDGKLILNSKVYSVERRVGELYITENYPSQSKEMIERQTKKFSEEYKKKSPKLKGQSQQEYDKALNDYVSRELEKTKTQQEVVNGKITLVVQKINEELHGAYSIRNHAPIQRTIFGSMLFQLKKFFFPGIQRRLGTIGSVFINYFPGIGLYAQGKLQQESYVEGEGSAPDRYFDPLTGTMRGSSWASALKFFFKAITDLKRLKWQVASENWAELTRNEKAAIKKTVTEIALIFTLPLIAGALKAAAEDDDDENSNYYTYSFLAYRLYSELVLYINPKEAMRILQNPTVTISFIERIIKFGSQLSSDVWGLEVEEYKSGSRKGDYKVMKNFYDLVPFYKHATRHKIMSDVINYYYRD